MKYQEFEEMCRSNAEAILDWHSRGLLQRSIDWLTRKREPHELRELRLSKSGYFELLADVLSKPPTIFVTTNSAIAAAAAGVELSEVINPFTRRRIPIRKDWIASGAGAPELPAP